MTRMAFVRVKTLFGELHRKFNFSLQRARVRTCSAHCEDGRHLLARSGSERCVHSFMVEIRGDEEDVFSVTRLDNSLDEF